MFEDRSNLLTVESWIKEIETLFATLQYSDNIKVMMAIPMLKGDAEFWWVMMKGAYDNNKDLLT